MRNHLALFGLLIFYQSLAWSDISIRVLDSQGQAVEHAVVSIAATQLADAPEPGTAAQRAAVMDQVDKQFLPHVLVVEKGRDVVFPNSDQVRHHVYSFSKPNDFEIKLYSGDHADPVRFEHPGIVVLGCNIHDQMVGYLYITDNEIARVSDAQGYVRFGSQAGHQAAGLAVTVWHSRLSSSKLERVQRNLTEPTAQGEWQIVLDLLPVVTKETRKFKPRFQ